MKLLPFYRLFAGSMTDFVNQFRHNEALYNQAKTYWNKLESVSLIVVIIFLFFGLFLTIYYYQPYNNRPGRHYTPKHWCIFLIITFVLTFLVTWGFEYLALPPRLDGATLLQIKIALGNSIYALGLYIVFSWIWCQFKYNCKY